jgi:hypothetical protein
MVDTIDLVDLLIGLNTLSEVFKKAKDIGLGVEQVSEFSGVRPILETHDEYMILGESKLTKDDPIIHAYNTGMNYKLRQS